jgi:predicted nucleotidyltransferase/DNA-binding MarR family transcriptional regulator
LGSRLPKMGTKKPKLGTSKAKRGTGLADALFSRTQQGVLGLLFGQPDRSFFATEIIRAVGAGSGTVQRELAKLEASGLAVVRMLGNQKHYQANPESPVFAELASIAQKTVGIAEPLRGALDALVNKIEVAFVYGSMAKRSETARSDIDLMVISNEVTYADVFAALEAASERLGRPINPTVHTRKDWIRLLKDENSFAVRVMRQPKIMIVGSEIDLAP